jgi:hypothetical protein
LKTTKKKLHLGRWEVVMFKKIKKAALVALAVSALSGCAGFII